MNKNVQKKEAQMWAQLEEYLIQELDSDTARTILTESQTKAHAFLAASDEPSPTRRATMQDTILPRVADLSGAEGGGAGRRGADGAVHPHGGGAGNARFLCQGGEGALLLRHLQGSLRHGHPEERRLGERVRRPEGAVHPGHPSVPVV